MPGYFIFTKSLLSNHFKFINMRVNFPSLILFYSTILVALSPFNALATSNLAQLKIEDNALLTCIQQQAQKHNWLKLEDILTLKCHGMKINNINGLESLTQLQSLSLYNNKITQIDLHSFSHLEHINIANNKLSTIKLTGLTNLKTLYLFKNNLTRLDFTGLAQLQKIRITNNQLTSLDISPLTSLEKAYFFDNKLEDLVVTGLPKLKFIELRQNPMPDEVYDRYDELEGITIIHDGNADDWK